MSKPSKNIPTATSLNTFRCSRVTGSRSSRASTLIADIFVSSVLTASSWSPTTAIPWISINMLGSAKPVTVMAALAGKSSPNISVRISVIGEEDGHRYNIFQGRPPLLERGFDVHEGLAHLRFEIACKRIAGRIFLTCVAGDPDDLASLGDDCGRERSRLLPRPAHE